MSYIGELVKSHFDAKGVRYDYYERTEERNEAIKVSYRCDNAESVSVILFFDEDGGSLNAKSFSIAKVPEAKLMDTYVLLNELNCEYRWVKFFIDDDNEVTVSGDAIIDETNAGEECYEIIQHYVGIIDDVYPRIMKVIWA